jgi:hypothetical protein
MAAAIFRPWSRWMSHFFVAARGVLASASRMESGVTGPQIMVGIVGLLALAAAAIGARLHIVHVRELSENQRSTLVIESTIPTANLVSAGGSWPRGGEVPFKINFTDRSPGGLAITVGFKWSDSGEDADWLLSPSLRLVSRNDESINGRIERIITVAAMVPALPAPPHRTRQPFEMDDIWEILGLWRSAEMQVRVTDPTASDPPDVLAKSLRIQISDRSIAAAIAFSIILTVIALLIMIERVRYRHSGLTAHLMQTVLSNDQRISLPHFQLMLWTLLVSFATFYFLSLTKLADQVRPEFLAVLGIAGATLLGAKMLVQQSAVETTDTSTSEVSKPEASSQSFYDLIASSDTVDPGRLQLFCVTLLGAAAFAGSLAFADKMPEVPTWALMVFGLSNGFYLLSASSSLSILRALAVRNDISDKVAKGVQAVMLGPEATQYNGFVRFKIRRRGVKTPLVHAGTLTFSTDPDVGDGWRAITIEEGRRADAVFFSAVLRCDDPNVPEIDRDLTIPVSGRQDVPFDLTFQKPGQRHIWITILQANRVVQILEADVNIKAAARTVP